MGKNMSPYDELGLKKKQKITDKELGEKGFKKLSQTTWTDGKYKIALIGRRISGIQYKPKIKFIRRHGITDDDRRLTGFYKVDIEKEKKKERERKKKEKEEIRKERERIKREGFMRDLLKYAAQKRPKKE